MLLSLEQAETELVKRSVQTSSWHESAGFLFRIFRVGKDFDCTRLPMQFQVLWTDDNGDSIIRELIDTIGEF